MALQPREIEHVTCCGHVAGTQHITCTVFLRGAQLAVYMDYITFNICC